jgi:hypothetical protein
VPLIGTHTSGGRSSGRADYRKSDAEYMAAPDQLPNITSLLPRGSHPYRVRVTMARAGRQGCNDEGGSGIGSSDRPKAMIVACRRSYAPATG